MLPTTFKDSTDREWSIRFDGVLLRELRDQHKIDLADITGTTYVRLERDQSDLVTTLLFLLREQARSERIAPSTLAAALVGDCLEGAMQAIWGAAKVFFRASLWSELQTNYRQHQEAGQKWGEIRPMLLILNQPDIPTALKDAVMEVLGQSLSGRATSELLSSTSEPSASGPDATPSPPATDSPAIAGSVQAA